MKRAKKRSEEEPKQKKIKQDTVDDETDLNTCEPFWSDYELLAEAQDLNVHTAKSTIKLFEEGNTIAFIARYRKAATGDLPPEKLRDIKEEYDSICALKARIQTVIKNIAKSGNLHSNIKKAVLSVHTIEELEHIYAPFKPGTKRSLAERAKLLGLEEPAFNLLNNLQSVIITDYIDASKDGLYDAADVEKGIMHIIASVIATDTEVLSFLRKLRINTNFIIETKKTNTKKAKIKKEDKPQKHLNLDENKFSNYFAFNIPQKYIKPHQVLAINRGEAAKVLSVKVVVPDLIYNEFLNYCTYKWINSHKFDFKRKQIIEMAIKDSYSRLVQPLIIREVRSELKAKAEKASLEVFSTNLKQLLLISPLKGRSIMGIDPGFLNGCKIATISETGTVLSVAVIYPHNNKLRQEAEHTLTASLKTNNCSLISLGNGTACRETETWLSDLIQRKVFSPLSVTYTIVNECGASIYSCSAEAKKEFPSLDPNLISAVSLARRIQDPLAELVKVEPKHLGVGMYQHDLPKKQLELTLGEIITECVSFVGVDLNTASQCLLRRVAGLTDKRATEIITFREKTGSFLSRTQLMDVKGIGAKVFEQCAGFLRIQPLNRNQVKEFYKNSATNPLDCTYIHPESYEVTEKLLKEIKLNLKDVGEREFCKEIERKRNTLDLEKISKSFGIDTATVNLIFDALRKPLNFDLRNENSQIPLFKKGITKITDLQIGCRVTGSVNNVTHFGCFVDIGVGKAGLLHQNKLRGFSLQIGDRVEVKVISIDIDSKRIGLEMVEKL